MDTIFNTDGCFYRALDDEPVFVLLSRDPVFSEIVRHWVTLRQALIGRGEKPLEDHSTLADAIETANAGHIWRQDATDPSKWPEEPRWRAETIPARELVDSDKMVRMEMALITASNKFLHYAQNHFDKGTPESIAKGEVNWAMYLEICETMGIAPAEKPTVREWPKFGKAELAAAEFEEWRKDAMPLGNDFLLGIFRGTLWFSQRHTLKANGEKVWSDLFMLQNSLQHDMLRAAFQDWRSHQRDRADHLKSLLPDYRGLAAKIATGLRQVVGDYLAVVRTTTWPTKRKEQMNAFADRIAGYAAELETGYHAGGTVTVNVDSPAVTSREQAERLRRHISEPSVKITPKPVPAEPAPAPEVQLVDQFREEWPEIAKTWRKGHEDSDTIDVTDVPDLPPHRFTIFHKAKGWAYGRGLEINPGHIPAMLDRMDASGWHLQAVFGGVDPQKVGMLFKRTGPGFGWPEPPSYPRQRFLGSYRGHNIWVAIDMPEEVEARLKRLLQPATYIESLGRGVEP